jgi:hypothetical protein
MKLDYRAQCTCTIRRERMQDTGEMKSKERHDTLEGHEENDHMREGIEGFSILFYPKMRMRARKERDMEIHWEEKTTDKINDRLRVKRETHRHRREPLKVLPSS